MRMLLTAALLLGLCPLVGCGGSEAPTDPNDIPPLTDEQKAEIQAIDAQVEDEEETGAGMAPE